MWVELLLDEFCFVFEVRVLLAGMQEGQEVEAVVVDDVVDDVLGLLVVGGLVADGARSRNIHRVVFFLRRPFPLHYILSSLTLIITSQRSGLRAGHHRLHLRLHVLELRQLELVLLYLFLFVGLSRRLLRGFHLRGRFVVALLQHAHHGVSLLLELELLLGVGIANHVFDGRRGSALQREYLLGTP